MSFPAILLLALGLSMDAAAVSAARGVGVTHIQAKHVARVALYFGGTQALMPWIGWHVGVHVGPYVEAWDHWIAFLLLSAIGGKLLWDAFHVDGPITESTDDLLAHKLMAVLAIATSIDALAVGITLPMLDAPLLLTITTIGITTATLSVLGFTLGHRFGQILGKRFDLLGGLTLIALGTKILLEHTRG